MCLSAKIKAWRKRRRDRIYEGPSIDGGTRICHDTDAPKDILSHEILRFSCRFSSSSLLEEDTNLTSGLFHFTAEKREEGAETSVSVLHSRRGEINQAKMRPSCFLEEIDGILQKHDIARFNGLYYKVSGLPDFFGASVSVTYASGETLDCYNNQDPFLPLAFILALCQAYGIEKEVEIQ